MRRRPSGTVRPGSPCQPALSSIRTMRRSRPAPASSANRPSSASKNGLETPFERKRDARTARGRSGGFGLSRDRGPVPGEQFVDAIDRVVGDAGDDVGEPSLGVDAVEASGPYERVHYGGSTAAFVGAGEEVVL